jgi:hypothetical protein
MEKKEEETKLGEGKPKFDLKKLIFGNLQSHMKQTDLKLPSSEPQRESKEATLMMPVLHEPHQFKYTEEDEQRYSLYKIKEGSLDIHDSQILPPDLLHDIEYNVNTNTHKSLVVKSNP